MYALMNRRKRRVKNERCSAKSASCIFSVRRIGDSTQNRVDRGSTDHSASLCLICVCKVALCHFLLASDPLPVSCSPANSPLSQEGKHQHGRTVRRHSPRHRSQGMKGRQAGYTVQHGPTCDAAFLVHWSHRTFFPCPL